MNKKMSIGERLKEERERLSYNQADFAAVGGASRGSQVAWEKGGAYPNAEFLAAIAAIGADVQYIITGERHPSAPPPAPIDWPTMERILAMLEAAAAQAGRRWPESRKLKAAVDVYNFVLEEGFEEAKIERILKLVVNN